MPRADLGPVFWLDPPITRLGHYQARRTSQRSLVNHAPARFGQPALHLGSTVDVAARDDQELGRHQRGKQGLGMAGVGPEVHQERSSAHLDGLPQPTQQLSVDLRFKEMDDVGDQEQIVAGWHLVAQEVSLHDRDPISHRSAGEQVPGDACDGGELKEGAFKLRVGGEHRDQEGPSTAADIQKTVVAAGIITAG